MHGALTHFPIAFLIFAVVFDIGALLLKKPEGRLISFWMLVVGAFTCLPALATGWFAGNIMYGKSPSFPAIFTLHRAIAFVTTGFAFLLLSWRYFSRDRMKKPSLVGALVLGLLCALTVTYTGNLGGTMLFGGQTTETAADPAESTPPPAPATQNAPDDAAVPVALIENGKKLYASNSCNGCHKINGQGGAVGPDLSHAGRLNAGLNWQVEHLKDPQKFKPNSTMPPYAQLKPDELKALAEYMVSLK
jgi:mono/diheme cytochrome c family protein